MNSHAGSWLRRALAALHLTDTGNGASSATLPPAATPARATSIQEVGMTRTLAWCGEIIAANAEEVWSLTSVHVADFQAKHTTLIIIDLARLRFIDSTGAALMARMKKWAQELRIEILFVHAAPNVRTVLRLTQVEQWVLEGSQ